MKTFARTRPTLAALVSLGALATASEADDNWSLTGYAKTYPVYQGAPDVKLDGEPAFDEFFQSQNAFRLMLAGDVLDNMALELHYEVKPVFYSKEIIGSSSFGTLGDNTASSYRSNDLSSAIYTDDKTQVLQNLDRLNIQFSFDEGDLTVGRQTISFGSARFVSPSDIFQPFAPSTLDQEYRSGVDAIRWVGSLGDMTEYDLGVVSNREGIADETVGYARIKTSLSGNDLEAVAIHREGMTILGAGWERALGLFGFWSEAAWTLTDTQYTPGLDFTEDYMRVSVGLDRAFGDNVFAMVEYHHSTFGTDDPAQYQFLPLTEGFQSGGVYLVGRDYLVPSISWTVTPLIGLGASAFVNLGDGSAFLRASGNYSVTDDLYADFGVFAGAGDGTQLETMIVPQFIDGSEFGSFPTTVYLSLRYYF